MRGGVSSILNRSDKILRSSPHAWGCFKLARRLLEAQVVFPTCVGVFLGGDIFQIRGGGLPHMRGGVSGELKKEHFHVLSSPHAWGCF